MASARTSPTRTTATTIRWNVWRSFPWTALATAPPVRNAIANWAACEISASTTEIHSVQVYGRRNPSRRTNVRRYRGRSVTLEI